MKTEPKKIQDIKEYFQYERPSGIILVENDAKLTIDISIVNIRTGGMGFVFIMLVIITVNIDFWFYLIPLAAGYLLVLGVIWAELDSLNDIVMDLENNTLQVRSNNFVKRFFWKLLKRENKYKFSDIAKFTLYHNWELNTLDQYYLIQLVLKNNKKIKLFYTQGNGLAVKLIDLLRTLINSK